MLCQWNGALSAIPRGPFSKKDWMHGRVVGGEGGQFVNLFV